MAFPPSHSFMFNLEEHDYLPSNAFPPQHFQGQTSLPRSMSFSGTENCSTRFDHHGEEDLSDDGLLQLGEKKKRLNMEQVKALEKSFELGNKLEPERKVQLAKALGLQPRQVAIWFQNRRARWKTKQLEKEYQILKKQFDALKADNNALKDHNHKLHAQLQALKSREWCESGALSLNKKETEGSWSGSDNSSDINLDLSRTQNDDKSLLPNSLKPTSITHLLQYSSSSRPEIQDEGFSNMFHNIDEQAQNLWPWPQNQNFH